ncbi:MAG: hypothetical protein GF355_05900 [Candidatus Eisenbacteria bacterium]|nr:hypothetical protein [Candidatus Eisenbacteria bacterium]
MMSHWKQTRTRAPLLAAAAVFLMGIALPTLSAAEEAPVYGERCLRQYLSTFEEMVVPLDPGTPMTGDGMTPPPDPGLGDSWLWYIWHLNGFPWAEQKMCTVRGIGPNVYVVVEDSQWNVNVFQDDIDYVVDRFENSSIGDYPDQGIWDLNTTHFGMPPDALDDDPRVYVLYYDFDVNADGFFWIYDQYPDGTQPFESNECEVVYMNCSDNDPGGDYLTAVVAHEFEHMIHFATDQNEVAWVDEGCGELAMWLYGHPDQVVAFPYMPDNDLTDWNDGMGFANYVQTYLWTLYFFEQYGGQPSIWALTHEPMNGVPGYENVLDDMGYSESFADVFSDWVVANYVDDVTFLDGRYGYVGEDLPPFSATEWSVYPVGPVDATVRHWAADYIDFTNGQPQQLNFDGYDATTFATRILTYMSGVPLNLQDMVLDGDQNGTFDLGGFGNDYDEAVLVVANITTGTGAKPYTYGTSGASAADGGALAAGGSWLTPSPHPLRAGGRLQLRIPEAGRADLQLYDVNGRMVWSWSGSRSEPGVREIAWSGRDRSGNPIAPGTYFARLQAGDQLRSARILVVD